MALKEVIRPLLQGGLRRLRSMFRPLDPDLPKGIPKEYFKERIEVTTSCRDTDIIPKVPDAGAVVVSSHGQLQVMHNGVRVLAHGYYGEWMTDVIKRLKGHHEPQEEVAFWEVLKVLPTQGTILELGSYWAYYSLWFLERISGGRAILVEPEVDHLEVGRQNFRLNEREGEFTRAKIGAWQAPALRRNVPPTTTVDAVVARRKLDFVDVLHCDVQGAELEMLKGAKRSFGEGRIGFVFISTHSDSLHAACQEVLKRYGSEIVASHTRAESFSEDGLIVARTNEAPAVPPITFSKR